MGVPPGEEVLFGEIGKQVCHFHVFELRAHGDSVCIDLDDDEHDDDQEAEGGVDDEGGDEQAVVWKKRVLNLLVVGRVDGLNDGQQRGSS